MNLQPSLLPMTVAGLLAGCMAQTAVRDGSSTTTRFLCDGGTTLTITFADGRATVESPAGPVEMVAQPAGSGFAYAGSGQSIRGKGRELRWTNANQATVTCREQRWAMHQPQVEPPPPSLAGTRWGLVAFQSSDDAIGKVIPPNVERYTMTFEEGGRLLLQLDCNRATGTWSVTSQSTQGGSLSMKGGPMTRAMCQQGALDSRLARDLARIRSFTLKQDRLFLALEADAGIYEFKRSAEGG